MIDYVTFPATVAKINHRYPEYNLSSKIRYDIPELEELEKHLMLPKSAKNLLKIYEFIITNKELYCDNLPIDINFWLCLFCVYENEFCATYDEYISNPDESIGIIDNIELYIENNFKGKNRT